MDSMYYNKEDADDFEQHHMIVDNSDFSVQKSKVAGFSFMGQEALSSVQL